MDTNRLGIMPEPKLSKESEHNLVFKPITLDSLPNRTLPAPTMLPHLRLLE